MSDFIASVEKITGSISSTTSTVDLGLIQDVDKCVPFATWQRTACSASAAADNGGLNCLQFNFVDNGGNDALEARRGYSLGGNDVSYCAHVVEFGVDVLVDKYTVECDSGGTFDVDLNQAITDIDKTFCVFYHQRLSGGLGNYDENCVSARILTAAGGSGGVGQVRIEKGSSATGICDGILYVVEDTGSNFDVIHDSTALTQGTSTDDVFSPSVAMASSFLIASYHTTQPDDDPDSAAVRIYLLDSTHVRSERYVSGSSVWIYYQVITLATGNVYRGLIDFPANDDQEVEATAFDAVDTDLSMAWCPSFSNGHAGLVPTSSGSDVCGTFIKIIIDGSATGVILDRLDYGDEVASVAWEVIEWEAGEAPTSAKLTAVDALLTLDEITAKLTAADALITLSEKTAKLTAADALLTIDEITAKLTAADVLLTLDEITAKLTAADVLLTLSEKTAKLTAADALITLDEKTAKLTAADTLLTLDEITAKLTAADALITLSEKTAKLTAADALITLDEKTAKLTAVDALLTFTTDVPTAKLTAVDALLTLDEITAKLTASDALITLDEKTAKLTAVDALLTLDEITAKLTAADALLTHTTITSAKLTAVDALLTLDEKTAKLTAADALITHTLKTAKLTAADALITLSEKTAKLTAADALLTLDEITAKLTAADALITLSEKTAKLTAADALITLDEKTAKLTAADALLTLEEIAAKLTAADALLTYSTVAFIAHRSGRIEIPERVFDNPVIFSADAIEIPERITDAPIIFSEGADDV